MFNGNDHGGAGDPTQHSESKSKPTPKPAPEEKPRPAEKKATDPKKS